MSDNEKSVSLNEFKSCLSGVLDFQPEGWVPDDGQWTKILDKINQLNDTTSIMAPPVSPAKGIESAVSTQPESRKPKNPRPHPPLSNDKVKLPPLPERKPDQLVVQSQGRQQLGDDGKTIDTGKLYKTNVIDTADGTYDSQFK